MEKAWHTHGYYGSVSHNVKAVYQRYMGWFDGNPPGRLWQHPPPQAAGPRYVAAMGGLDKVVELAQQAFDDGDLRWAATLLDHAIFTDENHAGARELYADTLEQLAYGAENAVWRNFFLSGATELREGNFGTPTQTTSPSLMSQLTPGADLRHVRHQRQRSAGLGAGPGDRRDVRRCRHQLPTIAAQRCTGTPQGPRRTRNSHGHCRFGEQVATVVIRGRGGYELAGCGGQRCCRRVAHAVGCPGSPGSGFRHHHALDRGRAQWFPGARAT